MSGRRLPPGWTEARLPDVVEINPPNPETPPDDDTPVSFVPMAAVQVMAGGIDTSESRPWRKVRKGYKRFQEGDVLFAKITPCMENGKLAVATGLRNGVGAGSTEFHVLRPSAAIRPGLLAYYLLRDDFRAAARSKMKGTAGQLRVPEQFLEAQTLPVPPLRDQKRIIKAIDSYFTRLDNVTATLERVRRNLKRHRASVLKAAVEGRLVPTEAKLAQAEGREYEPASVLLKRILVERRRRWEERELAKIKAAGKTPTNDDWKAKYKEPAEPDANALPSLPDGWCWTSIGQLFRVHVGATPKRNTPGYWNGSIPWVSSGEVAFCRIGNTRETITDAALRCTSTSLNPVGTVLVGMIGEGRTRGQTAILDIPACNNQNSAAIRVSETPVVPEYVYYVLMGQYHENRRRGAGNNQPALNKSRVQSIPLPLPPLKEQMRIAAAVADHLSALEIIERVLESEHAGYARLRQSILTLAIAGELASPASTLGLCGPL